jgi:hypothetical protein
MMTEQYQPDTVRWSRITAHAGGVVALLLLAVAFLTFHVVPLLLSFVLAVVALVAGIRARAEVGITLAVLALLGCIALIVGVAL